MLPTSEGDRVSVPNSPLDRGRAAYDRHIWSEAFDLLAAADREESLEPADLERLTIAAYLVGREDEHYRLRERLHLELLDRGDVPGAVRCAFWLGFSLLLKGELARAGRWLARGRSQLDADSVDCVERGYLLVPESLHHLFGGDAEASYHSRRARAHRRALRRPGSASLQRIAARTVV